MLPREQLLGMPLQVESRNTQRADTPWHLDRLGGRKVEHAPRLVDDAGGNEGAAGASADNRLLSILDAEINIKL